MCSNRLSIMLLLFLKILHDWVKTHFAVDKNIEIRFYEGYVETWATLLNVYMTVLYHKHQPRNNIRKHTKKTKQQRSITKTFSTVQKKRIYRVVQQLLEREQQFVMFQVAKVLVNSRFEQWEDFFVDIKSSIVRFAQTTSVFSYFIIRSAHLWDMSWFVKTFPFPDFKNNAFAKQTDCFDIWFEHLEHVYRSPSYCACINAYMQSIRSVSKNTLSDAVQDSMRMTCVEVL